MLRFASVSAKIQGNKVTIDTRLIAKNIAQRRLLKTPWWQVGSAAFLFDVKGELCVALVQRTHNTSHPCRWALIPAGVADTVEELRFPGLTVIRETREELKILVDGEVKSPVVYSEHIMCNTIDIHDTATGITTHDTGHIYVHGNIAFFHRVYKVNEYILHNYVLFDGETDLRGNPLDRMIALIPIDKLSGFVTPLKMYQRKKEIEPREIGLTVFETPTLEWFRGVASKI